MKILICGTPGTGKTTLAKKIEREFSIKHIDVSKFIKSRKIFENYNEKFDTYEFDEEFVARELNEFIKNMSSFVVDTHSPCVAVDIKFDYIFQLRSDFQTLRERLKDRGYSTVKIEENIDCEAFNVVGEEIEEYFNELQVIFVNGCNYDLTDVHLTTENIIEWIGQDFDIIQENNRINF